MGWRGHAIFPRFSFFILPLKCISCLSLPGLWLNSIWRHSGHSVRTCHFSSFEHGEGKGEREGGREEGCPQRPGEHWGHVQTLTVLAPGNKAGFKVSHVARAVNKYTANFFSLWVESDRCSRLKDRFLLHRFSCYICIPFHTVWKQRTENDFAKWCWQRHFSPWGL